MQEFTLFYSLLSDNDKKILCKYFILLFYSFFQKTKILNIEEFETRIIHTFDEE